MKTKPPAIHKDTIEPEPLRILVLCDYKATTGFATVSQNILPGIRKSYYRRYKRRIKMDICAINYYGELFDEDEDTVVFSAKNSVPADKLPLDLKPDDFGRFGFLYCLQNSQAEGEKGYHGVFIIQDAPVVTGMVPPMQEIKRFFQQNNMRNFKSLFYFPLDNNAIEAFTRDLDFFDTLVTYNEYSRSRVLHFKPELKKKLKVLPHGINPDHFHPLPDEERLEFRKEYFGDNANKFIILNLNRNQPRKDIPCTIMAFQEYKERNPDSFLYLHMNPKDPLGWDLRAVLLQTNLQEGIDYMFPPRGQENAGASIEHVNKIYNACDVYLTTTLGEGWGLGVTEAMGCRLPVICPMHTSFFEIGDNGNRVFGLDSLYPICSTLDNVVRQQCDYMQAADVLEQVQNEINKNSYELQAKLDTAQQYVLSLAWHGIVEKWVDYFKKTFG